ncbi:MAG: isocitrate/isopropylmalate dehydrogenase family protein [Planctomycetota bacterium]
MPHPVTLITGDGTGPELAEAARMVLEATGVDFSWDIQEAGIDVFEAEGTPLPDRVLDSIRRTRVALKAPITTPVGKGFRSVNVALRKAFELFACVRPCKSYPGVRSRYKGIDLVLIRENTEDLYAGCEFEEGKAETLELIQTIERLNRHSIREDSGISIKPISVEASRRIIRYGLEFARSTGRKKVALVHKANIMKFTDGLWLDIEFEDRIVDNMCMQLVQRPEEYQVLITQNLTGDILSDLCAGLVGGLGVAPGANIGADCAIFEATHGSAPKYKGMDKVNPTALILSGMLLLRHLGEKEAADRLEGAVAHVLGEGRFVTYDMKPRRDDPSAVGTRRMAQAVVEALQSGATATTA